MNVKDLPSAAAVEQVANFQRIEIAARLLQPDAKLHMDVSATARRILCERALEWADTLLALAAKPTAAAERKCPMCDDTLPHLHPAPEP